MTLYGYCKEGIRHSAKEWGFWLFISDLTFDKCYAIVNAKKNDKGYERDILSSLADCAESDAHAASVVIGPPQ